MATEGKLQITMKEVPKPLPPYRMENFVAYRVSTVHADFKDVAVGDIVVKFGGSNGGVFVLNCTREQVIFDRSHNIERGQFSVYRAHDVRSIELVQDGDDNPYIPTPVVQKTD